MRRIRTKSTPYGLVLLEPRAYEKLMALSRESRRPMHELMTIAIDLFAQATRNIIMMHQPKFSKGPQLPEQREAAIAAALPKPDKPKSEPKKKSTTVPPIGGTVQRAIRKLTKGKQP